ncbi:MAG: type II toxin-antitoxin system RelE family toxin [Candidatus Acidiferrales bacterium]
METESASSGAAYTRYQGSLKDIRRAVDELTNFPNVANVKHLTRHRFPYRLRVGRYRVFFTVEAVAVIIEIEEVKKRDERTY